MVKLTAIFLIYAAHFVRKEIDKVAVFSVIIQIVAHLFMSDAQSNMKSSRNGI